MLARMARNQQQRIIVKTFIIKQCLQLRCDYNLMLRLEVNKKAYQL